MNFNELKMLKKIAVVGTTTQKDKYGYVILKFLQEHTDYMLYPINPKLQDEYLLSLKVYPSLSDVPDKLDLVVAVVPPAVTKQVLVEAVRLEIPNFWCQPGTADLQLSDLARGKIRLVTDKCIMVVLS